MRFAALLLACASIAASAAEKVYTVSPSGPYRTISAALSSARAERGAAAARIVLSGGRHELDSPIILGSPDSGLTFAAAENAKPILSGGRRIAGWKRDTASPNLWTAEVPQAREGRWAFRQLFVDGRRAIRARTPNAGYFRIAGASPQDKPVKLRFKPGDIKKEYAGRGIEAIALLAWADIRMQIVDVNPAENVATLSGDPRPSNKEDDARYYLENAIEFLDAPGEWFLDTKTGRVSYLARAGEDLTKAETIAPLLEDLIILEGAAGNPVKNIRFENIEFSHTDWVLGASGYADTQAAVATRGDLRARYAHDLVIENCRFTHLAGYAIDLGEGCQGARIVGNEMADLGGGGVRFGETSLPRDLAAQNHSHTLTDNHMHQLGRVYPPAVGVFIMQSATNRIAHNHIHDLYYTAVSIGWNWGYSASPCRENIVEFNHLHDIGQEVLSDMGAVYTLGPQPGTVIRNNLVHDVASFNYGGWGLYTDEGSTGILLENNIVYRCKDAGFHQHYGRENVVRNNIFAFNQKHQLMRTRPEPHISFIFTNNIVYFDTGTLLGSNWSNDNYTIDRNLYFDARQPDSLKFAGATLEVWQKRGHDQNSVIANPKFLNPGNYDFRLDPDSPALKLGFKPIDLSTVGPRRK